VPALKLYFPKGVKYFSGQRGGEKEVPLYAMMASFVWKYTTTTTTTTRVHYYCCYCHLSPPQSLSNYNHYHYYHYYYLPLLLLTLRCRDCTPSLSYYCWPDLIGTTIDELEHPLILGDHTWIGAG